MQLPVNDIPASTEIHIIAPFLYSNGGDWHAIDLYEEYSKTHRVTLWSAQPVHQAFFNYPISIIRPYRGECPYKGILLLSGARTEIGSWYNQNHFEKTVIIHNLLSPGVLYRILHHLRSLSATPVEITYVSKLVANYAGLPGRTIHHRPSVKRYQPQIRTYSPDRFIIGRISTDILAKHHHSDIWLYKQLASQNIPVRIIGGTCLMPWLKNETNISLLSTQPQSRLPQLYQDLDCFYYRVPSLVKDPFPLVVLEAMQSGLPVICHKDVGTVEIIEHGKNGFIFETADEALAIISMLKKNANLRLEIGMQARERIDG